MERNVLNCVQNSNLLVCCPSSNLQLRTVCYSLMNQLCVNYMLVVGGTPRCRAVLSSVAEVWHVRSNCFATCCWHSPQTRPIRGCKCKAEGKRERERGEGGGGKEDVCCYCFLFLLLDRCYQSRSMLLCYSASAILLPTCSSSIEMVPSRLARDDSCLRQIQSVLCSAAAVDGFECEETSTLRKGVYSEHVRNCC